MEVFRLSRAKYADQLSGYGAALKGARWNSRGVEMIYAAENRSLAMAEVLVHLSLAMLPKDFMMLTIFIPDEIEVFNLPVSQLSDGWNSFPHRRITQELGDRFIIEQQYAVMRVPSVNRNIKLKYINFKIKFYESISLSWRSQYRFRRKSKTFYY